MSRPLELGRPVSGKRRLKDLLLQKDNRLCADCGALDPKWASANIGVFICLKCCGVHRSLGTHISKVLSVTLDDWSDDEIDSMFEVGGNSCANAIYEAFIPEGYAKPGPDAGHDERATFIRLDMIYNSLGHSSPAIERLYPVHTDALVLPDSDAHLIIDWTVCRMALWAKYELQEFLKPSLRIVSLPSRTSSLKSNFSTKIMDSLRSNSSQKSEGMVEFIGLLKVKVIKGTDLAIRDMMTSDPYVILTLGQQTVQTTIIKSNLNPVWNDELMLSVPQCYGALKLRVFDHDTFSSDDIMGEAEVDLQPLITSAMAFGDAGMFGNMQIGKWLKSHDNALLNDSTVNIVDGKVKQEVSLKLQNVESGDLELELEWMPLDQ